MDRDEITRSRARQNQAANDNVRGGGSVYRIRAAGTDVREAENCSRGLPAGLSVYICGTSAGAGLSFTWAVFSSAKRAMTLWLWPVVRSEGLPLWFRSLRK